MVSLPAPPPTVAPEIAPAGDGVSASTTSTEDDNCTGKGERIVTCSTINGGFTKPTRDGNGVGTRCTSQRSAGNSSKAERFSTSDGGVVDGSSDDDGVSSITSINKRSGDRTLNGNQVVTGTRSEASIASIEAGGSDDTRSSSNEEGVITLVTGDDRVEDLKGSTRGVEADTKAVIALTTSRCCG